MKITVHVLIEECAGTHVARCLEMGLVAAHDDPEQLPSIMAKLVSRQLEFALKNDNPADIYHPAPPEVWERLLSSCRGNRRTYPVEFS